MQFNAIVPGRMFVDAYRLGPVEDDRRQRSVYGYERLADGTHAFARTVTPTRRVQFPWMLLRTRLTGVRLNDIDTPSANHNRVMPPPKDKDHAAILRNKLLELGRNHTEQQQQKRHQRKYDPTRAESIDGTEDDENDVEVLQASASPLKKRASERGAAPVVDDDASLQPSRLGYGGFVSNPPLALRSMSTNGVRPPTPPAPATPQRDFDNLARQSM
jgi:hypothetical protein